MDTTKLEYDVEQLRQRLEKLEAAKAKPRTVVETIRKEELDLKEQLKKEDAQKRYAELLAQQQAFSSLKEQVTKAPSFVTRGNVIDKPISYEEPPPAPKFWTLWTADPDKGEERNFCSYHHSSFDTPVYCFTREMWAEMLSNYANLRPRSFNEFIDTYIKSNVGV